jgi:hypothetical protein
VDARRIRCDRKAETICLTKILSTLAIPSLQKNGVATGWLLLRNEETKLPA